ncbi:MAG: hypothetical protein M1838_002148 [Thelocarpon superellum]|nr:MAG: hypothetical protein M1838_002148 [Thelocarpon superellum]
MTLLARSSSIGQGLGMMRHADEHLQHSLELSDSPPAKIESGPRLSTKTRLGKVSMSYGEGDALYQRALANHDSHNRRHGYTMTVLGRQIQEGYWSKLLYLQSVLVQELAKPAEERLEWIMWVDADSVILNPTVDVRVFLPPLEFGDVHFLGTTDDLGLNSGIFFTRVHQWSVKMVSATIAVPICEPDLDLEHSPDQRAMEIVLNRTGFEEHTVYPPRTWFNAYYHDDAFQGKRGDLLVHFPAVPERNRHMEEWLNMVDQHPKKWAIPYEETTYEQDIDRFWNDLSLRRAAKSSAEQSEPPPSPR